MAKVYSLPKELEEKLSKPDYINFNLKEVLKQEEEFLGIVRNWAVERNPTDKYAGVEYSIPMADGHAQYIVLSSSPVQLMHLPLGDAWNSPFADRIRKSDIVKFVKMKKILEEGLDKSRIFDIL
jgi:hypothetical protein